MKYFVLLLFIANSFLFAQKEITEYSDDGKSTAMSFQLNTPGFGIKTNSDVPFGTQPSWQSTIERQVGGLAFADYDNDGDLDLAVGNYFSNSYPPINEYETQIYRNDNGVLTSAPVWVSTDMRSTTDVRWADINQDGYIDLLAANGNQSLVPSVIYMNSASGLETTPSWISGDQNWTVGAAFADVDGDHDLDLIFANQGETNIPTRPINIFFNNNGVLSTVPGFATGDQMITNTVAMADLNNNDLTSDTKLFTSSGTGTAYHLPYVPFYSVDSVIVNGSVVSNYCYDGISGWVSLGSVPPQGSSVKIVYRYMSKPDMGACKWVNYQSGVYFNNNGVMSAFPGWTVGNTTSQKGMGWADIDNDGFKDLAIGGSGGPAVLYKNNNGVLETSPVWSSNSTSTSTQDLIWGDVNKDGYPDLAMIHFGNKRAEIFINRAGVLDADPSWQYIPASSSNAIAFGDVNGDGWLDLAIGTARSPVMLFLADPSIIPVELISFTAAVENNQIKLNWSTATETNNKGFNLYRMVPEGSWELISFIEGKGTTAERTEYSFTDFPQFSGEYKYKLEQIDFGGEKAPGKVINVNFSAPNTFNVEQNYPNPFNPSTKIKFNTPSSGSAVFSVFDVLGSRVYMNQLSDLKAGIAEFSFSAGRLSSGVYLYRIDFTAENGKIYTAARKMIITK